MTNPLRDPQDRRLPRIPEPCALVIFGVTGDLAHKKIFPALYAMCRHGKLDVPIVGVAKSGWTLDDLKERARDAVRSAGAFDEQTFAHLAGLMRYVDGDYRTAETFAKLRAVLDKAAHPLHCLAIPPSMFPTVVEGLARVALDEAGAEGEVSSDGTVHRRLGTRDGEPEDRHQRHQPCRPHDRHADLLV